MFCEVAKTTLKVLRLCTKGVYYKKISMICEILKKGNSMERDSAKVVYIKVLNALKASIIYGM